MNLDPDNILADPDARDILVTVLNAMDGRIDPELRKAAILETAMQLTLLKQGSDEHSSVVGCVVGLLIKLADEAQFEAAAIIDTFRREVRDAHARG